MFHLVGFSSLDFARRYGTVRLDYDTAYAVERAGDIARVDRMGDHDWFGEGAEWFIAIQSKNGAWGADQPKGRASDVAGPMDAGDVLASTCFALLFLARATPPVLTHALDDTDINFAVAPTLSDKDFADFLDLVLSRWRRIDDSGVKARLFAKTTAVGPRIVALLIKRLSSDKDEDRTAAFALLKHATGLDNGYDPAAKPEARDVAVAAWTSWWTANEKTLHFDAAKGLLIP
jgi:hypothetical protein